MAEQNIQPQPQQKKGFFEKLSLFQKILLFVGVIVILLLSVGMLLGGIESFYQFFFYLIVFIAVVIGAYVVLKATGMIFQPRYFSPREDLKTKIQNMAIDYKPDNVNDLYFVGDIGKKRVRCGKIQGLLGLPYYTGEVERYETDVIEDGVKIHRVGDVVYTSSKDPDHKPVPKYRNIMLANGGDTLFIVRSGNFLLGKTHMIRCNKDLHSTLNGDVEIYDINPVPYGYFEYPFKQMQKGVTQVMIQNQIETILATHEHQHDLISQSVDSAIWFNPYMRMSMKQQSELPTEE